MPFIDDYRNRDFQKREAQDRERFAQEFREANSLREKHRAEEQFIQDQRREEDVSRASFPLCQETIHSPLDGDQLRRIDRNRREEDRKRHTKQQDELRDLVARHRAMEDLIWKSREKEDGLS